jgi:hypothetical protein
MVVMETGRVEFFLLDGEANLPTFFSTLMFLEAAVLLAVIAANARAVNDRFWMHWTLLCVLFFLMAVDEAAQVHEKVTEPLRNLLGLSGLLTNAWVLPAFVFVLVAMIFFWRFVFSLERRLSILFIAAAALYLSGVMGVEMISGYFKSAHGFSSLSFILSTTLEETLEMLGAALFIYALCTAVNRRNLALAVVRRGQG